MSTIPTNVLNLNDTEANHTYVAVLNALNNATSSSTSSSSDTSPVIASGSGTGNQTITVSTSNFLSIQNSSSSSMSVVVGSLTITIAAGSSFNDYLASFTSITVTSIGNYNWTTKNDTSSAKYGLAAGTNTGNQAITVPVSTYFSIQNTGSMDLNFTIGSLTTELAAGSAFDDYFSSFTTINVVATGSYNYYTK